MAKSYKRAKREQRERIDETAKSVLTVLSKSHLVKEHPTNPEDMIALVRGALKNKHPLQLIAFWGGSRQGEEKQAGQPEHSALQVISELRDALREKGLQTNLHLLLMDTHSRHVNLRPQEELDAYSKSMGALSEKYGFTLSPTSKLYSYSPLPSKATSPSQKKWAKSAAELLSRVNADEAVGSILGKLSSAHGSDGESLKRYIEMHAYEDPLLARKFPGAVFLSFGHPKVQKAISTLPTVFLYQQKEKGKAGTMGVPWFRE